MGTRSASTNVRREFRRRHTRNGGQRMMRLGHDQRYTPISFFLFLIYRQNQYILLHCYYTELEWVTRTHADVFDSRRITNQYTLSIFLTTQCLICCCSQHFVIQVGNRTCSFRNHYLCLASRFFALQFSLVSRLDTNQCEQREEAFLVTYNSYENVRRFTRHLEIPSKCRLQNKV